MWKTVSAIFFEVFLKSDSVKIYRVMFIQVVFETCFHRLLNIYMYLYKYFKFRLIVQELRETFQNRVINLTVEAARKCHVVILP